MKKLFQPASVTSLVMVCAVLLGCETPPKQAPAPKPVVKAKEAPPPAPPPAPVEPAVPVVSPDVQALKDGTALYDGGDYNGAIKKLSGAGDIWNGHNKDVQINALKIMAFSYCVTSRTQLCRQQFDKALKLDPSFSLSAAEIGHPVWGPVFLKSKNAVKAPAPVKKKDSTAVSK